MKNWIVVISHGLMTNIFQNYNRIKVLENELPPKRRILNNLYIIHRTTDINELQINYEEIIGTHILGI